MCQALTKKHTVLCKSNANDNRRISCFVLAIYRPYISETSHGLPNIKTINHGKLEKPESLKVCFWSIQSDWRVPEDFPKSEYYPKMIWELPNSAKYPHKQSNYRRCRRLSDLLRFISMSSPCHKGKPCFYNACVLINNTITRMIDGNFGNVSAGVLFSKVAYQWKRW